MITLEQDFYPYVPASAQWRMDEGLLSPLISSDLLRTHAPDLRGAAFEVSLAIPWMVVAAMHALRFHDGILAISLPRSLRGTAPDAAQRAVEAMVALSDHVGYDRPLILVSRIDDVDLRERGGEEKLLQRIHQDVEAGFTALSFKVNQLPLDDVDRFAQATSPMWDQGIGVELEFDEGQDPTLFLAQIADTAMPLAAVRGALPTDDVAGAFHVVDPLFDALEDEVPLRLILDGTLAKRLVRSGPPDLADPLRFSMGAMEVDEALVDLRDGLVDLTPADVERLEAFLYSDVEMICRRMGGRGMTEKLLAALGKSAGDPPS